mgnify:CR=1 FL=1
MYVALQEFPDAYFYHASEQYASLLHDMGYFINDVGAETTLQVNSTTKLAASRFNSARQCVFVCVCVWGGGGERCTWRGPRVDPAGGGGVVGGRGEAVERGRRHYCCTG